MKKLSSKRIAVAKPIKPVLKRVRTRRHHASEAWRPRATDLCADRIAALATCVALQGPLVMPNGERVDVHTLESLAKEQLAREHDLQETFGKARVVYEDYHRATTRAREVLQRGIEHFEKRMAQADPIVRTALRTAMLRRPPKAMLARLEAIKAKRKSGDTGG
jgi:hypothetical protein